MKKFKYIAMLILSMSLLHSCLVDNTLDLDKNGEGPNLATFESFSINLVALANGDEYAKTIRVKVVGPDILTLSNDVTVTVAAAAGSTAVEGTHYNLPVKTITLSADNNFLGLLDITMLTAGNTPPMDGTPEFEDYVAPVIILEIVNVSGDAEIIPSGKAATVILNFTPPNPYAGDYDTEMRYFHPTAGGSHPSFPDFDPNDPYGGIREEVKTLTAITGRKCETGFGVWADTDICWITVNADNSVTFEVWDGWPYTVLSGNPFDASQVSYFDPDTRQIFLYYHYEGAGGARIFWEVFTPLF